MKICVNCGTRVLPTTDNYCTACKKPIDKVFINKETIGPGNTHRLFNKYDSQRHGCASIYFYFIILCSPILLLFLLIGDVNLYPLFSLPIIFTKILLSVFISCNLIFSIALLKWKLWGAYGLVTLLITNFIINLVSGINILAFVIPYILYIIILVTVFFVGGKNNLWNNLN
jgi:hypothetical protein